MAAEDAPPLPKALSPQALRALEEAALRRAKMQAGPRPTELGGAPGPEPTRFGDWSKNGIASDF